MIKSHLACLREEHPEFNWPKQGERRNYPKELGAELGDIRCFGFLRYKLIIRTSNEKYAMERKGEPCKQRLITYNPIRLETFCIWERI